MRRVLPPSLFFAVVCCVIGVIGAVSGEAKAGEPLDRDAREAFGFVRMDFAAGGRFGDKLVGVGSRGRFQMIDSVFDLDFSRFPTERLGFDLRVAFSPTALGGAPAKNGENLDLYFSMRGLVDVGVIKWGGAAPGGLVVGLGGGFDTGNRLWFVDKLRVFAQTMVRARHWLTREWRLQGTWMYLPTSTATWKVREHVFEAAAGWQALEFGLRLDWTSTDAGAPVRTYHDIAIAGFVGASFF